MTEEVMEQVQKKLLNLKLVGAIKNGKLNLSIVDVMAILSIPIDGKTIKELVEDWASGKLRELDADQSLPESKPPEYLGNSGVRTRLDIQREMLKDNWMKVLKEEKSNE